jgi:AcrR family transcriptional regulator
MPRSKNPARQLRVEQRRSQILDAAARVFAREGYERATMASVAREAGLGTGSLYNYFKSKADLLVSLPRYRLQPIVAAWQEPAEALDAENTPPPDQVLQSMARTLLTVARQNAPLIRIFFSAIHSFKPSVRQKYLDQVVVYYTGVIEQFLHLEAKRGNLRPDLDPHLLARAFFGMFFPFIMLHDVLQLDGEPYDAELVAETLVDLYLNGASTGKGLRK